MDNISSNRQISIDALRAVTMLLMIFVNDFWTLEGIPQWLGHAEANEDRMGFSDVIFPAFLFIVGLAIPLAIQNRVKKGVSNAIIVWHILLRSAALIIIGVFHVNIGNYSGEALIPRPVWVILITISFFLIWLDYPKERKGNAGRYLKSAGIVLLIALAIIHSGEQGALISLQPKWWGILGLIGWTYFISSMVFLLSKGRMWVQILAFLFFVAFNSATQLGWLDFLTGIRNYVWIVGDGSMPALATAGVIISLLYQSLGNSSKKFWISMLLISVVVIVFGLATRPLWGISKIKATPSWTMICLGLSILSFAVMVYITDVKRITKWYDFIKPAGVITLTCYLLPYIYQSLIELTGFSLPVFLRTGFVGLIKSFVLSFLIIQIAGWLGKKHIRLKL
ncbi:MAG: DUF5009 domain-containing protein [Sphingobacteriaceae bacterium]